MQHNFSLGLCHTGFHK